MEGRDFPRLQFHSRYLFSDLWIYYTLAILFRNRHFPHFRIIFYIIARSIFSVLGILFLGILG